MAGYAPLPWGIDMLLTDACNLRCTYCPITTDMVTLRPSAVMDTDKAIEFIDSLASFKPMIRFFGGEPFLHPQWPRIFAAAVGHGLPITVVTNGTRLEGKAEELINSGLLAVGISIDPPTANDMHRGDGTFAICERVVHEIREARARLASPTPQIEIYSTVYEGTYASLREWTERLRDWRIDTLRFQHQIWLRTAQRAGLRADDRQGHRRLDVLPLRRRHVLQANAMPQMDFEVLESELRYLQDQQFPYRLEFHPPLPVEEMMEFYRNPDFKRQTARPCTLISNYAFVDPRGRLYPCLTLDMGNVFERPFESVWNGRKFRAFRKLLRREQRLPLCERCPA